MNLGKSFESAQDTKDNENVDENRDSFSSVQDPKDYERCRRNWGSSATSVTTRKT